MNIIEIFEELLPVESPFFIDFVTKDEEKLKVTIHLSVEKDYRPHSDCGTVRQYYERTWEHINLFQYRCFIKCKLPIYDNVKTGKTEALQVAFSRKHSRFTLLFEQEVLRLLRLHQCQKQVAQQLQINTQRVEKIYHDYTRAPFEEYEFEPCTQIGIDETSTRKGHNYFSIIVDMDKKQPIDIQLGKGADVIENFFHCNVNPQIIQGISIDMSPSFISGCQNFFPWVFPTFDKWHVYKLLGKHLYKLFKKYPEKQEAFDIIWNELRAFYNRNSFEKAETQLAFIADYAESVFDENKFSKSIRQHFDGILEHIRSKLTNGILEGINSKIQTLKRIAKGFRDIENFKKMVFFIFDVIQPKIPNTM
jgi:transposase